MKLLLILSLLLFASCSADKGQSTADKAVVSSQPPVTYDSAYYAKVNAESKARIDAMTGGQAVERKAAKYALDKVLPSLKVTKDEFTGVTRYHARSAPRFINKNGIDVYFARAKNEAPAKLRWSIQYAADDWLFIERYLFNIDGQQYQFTPTQVRRDNGNGMIWEWFDDSVDDQSMGILDALAKAKSAKMRLQGKDYQDDKPITKAQLDGIRNILAVHEALSTLNGN